MTAPEGVRTEPPEWDVRVASLRDLLRTLQVFLDDRGYAQRRAPTGSAASTSEVLGERDLPKRDVPYLVVGIALLPTVLLTNLGITFIRQSRYSFRTMVRIGVEGEPGLVSGTDLDSADAPGAVRVTIRLEAGAARGEGGIWRPTDDRREVARLARERRMLEQGLSELLRSMGAP